MYDFFLNIKINITHVVGGGKYSSEHGACDSLISGVLAVSTFTDI